MKQNKVTIENSSQISIGGNSQLAGVRGEALLKLFPQYRKATIYKHAKKPINGEKVFDRRSTNQRQTKEVNIAGHEKRNVLC